VGSDNLAGQEPDRFSGYIKGEQKSRGAMVLPYRGYSSEITNSAFSHLAFLWPNLGGQRQLGGESVQMRPALHKTYPTFEPFGCIQESVAIGESCTTYCTWYSLWDLRGYALSQRVEQKGENRAKIEAESLK